MVKVTGIKKTANDKFEQVELTEVLDAFQKAQGKRARKVWIPIAVGTHKFFEGMEIACRKIVAKIVEGPQHDKHEPFNGKYYVNELVEC